MPAHDRLEAMRLDQPIPRVIGRRSGTMIDPGRTSIPHTECECEVCEDYREAGIHEYHYRCQTRHQPIDDCPADSCDDCRNSGFVTPMFAHRHCISCGSPVGMSDLYCDGCIHLPDNDDDDSHDDDYCRCENCAPTREYTIHDHSYRPRLTFYGDGPLYLGMELELEIRNATSRKIEECAELANDALEHGDLGYLKYDGSLRYGFEIVTHPMSYPYFVERFPWEMLRKLREEGGYTNSHCGIHVHVSRAGFKGESHQYKWLAWWHRSKDEVTAFARRDPEDYASFNQRERQNVKQYAKGRRYGSRWSAERYSAVNVTPPDTYEVRVFRSTLDKIKAQACLGLVDSSVKYTDQLRAHDALKNGAWGWSGYRSWLFETDNGLYSPVHRTINRIGV